jgi:hypothetical protein
MKRPGLNPGPSLPRGLLEYYGMLPRTTSDKSSNPMQTNEGAQTEPMSGTVSEALPAESAMSSTLAERVAVQTKSDGSASKSEAERVHEAAAHGTSGPSGALPYIDQIQKSFGRHDVSHIQAHTDSQAAAGAMAMGAEAFTVGEQVAFAGSPSLHTAAHEAAHVVQQRAGVQLKGGVGEVGDRYEQHADVVADHVVRGESAEAVLDAYAGPALPRADAPGRHGHELQQRALDDGGAQEFIPGQPAGQGSDPRAHAVVQRQEVRKQAPQTGEETAAQGAWRASGNLRGNPPVRSEEHPPNVDVVEDERIYMQRLEAALAFQANQTARADSLLDREGNVTDNRYWFARVYSFVTDREIAEARNTTFFYPSYVLQCVRYFEQIYADNFAAHDAGGTVEDHWREAFRICADNEGLTWNDIVVGAGMAASGAGMGAGGGAAVGSVIPVAGTAIGAKVGAIGGGIVGLIGAPAAARAYAAAQSLVASMQAHIRFDLPRAEAWVFQHSYRGQGSAAIGDFHPDFNSMTDVFEQATDRMNADIAKRTGAPVELMPRILQDLALDLWFEANMATERADTWERAESLVANQLTGEDPYQERSDGTLGGNVTSGQHLSGLQEIPDASLRPTMQDPAAHLSDTAIRDDVSRNGAGAIRERRASERISMLRRLLSGVTGDDDESTILTILEASKTAGDVVTVIDGANAWDLSYAVDGDEFGELQAFLRDHYYAATSTSMAFSLIRRCMDGWTGEWQQEMIADLLVKRHGIDGDKLLTQIGNYYEGGGFAEGLNKVQWQLDGANQRRVDDIYDK